MHWKPIYNTFRYLRRHGCRIFKEYRLIMIPEGFSGKAAERHLDIALRHGYDSAAMMFDSSCVLSSQHGDTQICKTEGRSAAGKTCSPGADSLPAERPINITSNGYQR